MTWTTVTREMKDYLKIYGESGYVKKLPIKINKFHINW